MLNTVTLMGRLTKDPEVRVTPSGAEVCTFSLAVERDFARPGEEKKTDFINIVTFSKTAEFVSKYFSKGQLVAVAGRIQSRTWEDQNGNKRYATDVLAERCYFAEPKRDPVQNYNQQESATPSGNSGSAPLFDESDLPF